MWRHYAPGLKELTHAHWPAWQETIFAFYACNDDIKPKWHRAASFSNVKSVRDAASRMESRSVWYQWVLGLKLAVVLFAMTSNATYYDSPGMFTLIDRPFADDILDAFSWMKMCVFLFKFHWSLFQSVQFTTISEQCSNSNLPQYEREAIVWSNGDEVHWGIHTFASHDLSVLNCCLRFITRIWLIASLAHCPLGDVARILYVQC